MVLTISRREVRTAVPDRWIYTYIAIDCIVGYNFFLECSCFFFHRRMLDSLLGTRIECLCEFDMDDKGTINELR